MEVKNILIFLVIATICIGSISMYNGFKNTTTDGQCNIQDNNSDCLFYIENLQNENSINIGNQRITGIVTFIIGVLCLIAVVLEKRY